MAEYVRVAKAEDLPAGGLKSFNVSGTAVAIANVDGTLYGFDNVCTHRGCPLARGTLHGSAVTCRCHGSVFDVVTGAVLNGPAERPVATYPVRLNGDEVQVEV